jgi:single-stranded-DNA-specific exonuclease
MLQDANTHLDRYGGHEQAGGLTVKLEDIEAMKHQMQSFATKISSSVDTTQVTTADTRLHDHECTIDTVKDLQILAPYGIGNESPLFILENVTVQHARSLGK